jgi:hypothetical protein
MRWGKPIKNKRRRNPKYFLNEDMETDTGGQTRSGTESTTTSHQEGDFLVGVTTVDPDSGEEVGGQSHVPPELQRWSDAIDAKYGTPAGLPLALFYAIADMAFIESKCRNDPHTSDCTGHIQDQVMDVIGGGLNVRPRVVPGMGADSRGFSKYAGLILRALNNNEYSDWLQERFRTQSLRR